MFLKFLSAAFAEKRSFYIMFTCFASPIFSKILYRKIDDYLSSYIKKCIIRIGERKIKC